MILLSVEDSVIDARGMLRDFRKAYTPRMFCRATSQVHESRYPARKTI